MLAPTQLPVTAHIDRIRLVRGVRILCAVLRARAPSVECVTTGACFRAARASGDAATFGATVLREAEAAAVGNFGTARLAIVDASSCIVLVFAMAQRTGLHGVIATVAASFCVRLAMTITTVAQPVPAIVAAAAHCFQR